jgi:enamine deaminase RidA (YjgF/YER057c/UK114 family)
MAMTSQDESDPSSERPASRRDFVTAVTAAAAATAAASGPAQAQTSTNVRHSNPPGMSQPAGYSQLVEINGAHRLIFVAGQTGTDAGGKPARGFRAQMMQAYANIRTALASVGGSMNDVVRLTTYITDIEQNADIYREVRAATFTDKSRLPASTLVQVVRLADPAYLVEVDAIAILPPRV